MNKYKSWKGLNKQLSSFICEPLRNRITYFLTRYHEVHNAYGRAAILLDKNEIVSFSWTDMHKQEYDNSKLYRDTTLSYDKRKMILKDKWYKNCTLCEFDFLEAATEFLKMPIYEAIQSENYIIRILAVLDKRIGKRTIMRLHQEINPTDLPQWLYQFYELRFSVSD